MAIFALQGILGLPGVGRRQCLVLAPHAISTRFPSRTPSAVWSPSSVSQPLTGQYSLITHAQDVNSPATGHPQLALLTHTTGFNCTIVGGIVSRCRIRRVRVANGLLDPGLHAARHSLPWRIRIVNRLISAVVSGVTAGRAAQGLRPQERRFRLEGGRHSSLWKERVGQHHGVLSASTLTLISVVFARLRQLRGVSGTDRQHVQDGVVLGLCFAQAARSTSTSHRAVSVRPLTHSRLQDKAERLMATTGHLFEEMMAIYHSLGIAGTGKSTNIQWAIRQLWKRYCLEFQQRNLSSAVTRVLSGILNSSVLPFSSPSVSPQTVPQLTRVTAGGTVMFELESLVIQHFGSRHAYSSWRSIAEFGAGIPARSPRTNICWTSWALSFRRETRANCVLYGSSRGFERPRQRQSVSRRRRSATSRTRWPHAVNLVLLERSLENHPTSSGPSDSSGGNMTWDFTRATSAVCS